MTRHRSVPAVLHVVIAALSLAVPLSTAAQQTRKPQDQPTRKAATPALPPGRVVTRPPRTQPLDLKTNSLKLNGSTFDIEVTKAEELTVTWQLDASQAGTATGVQIRVRAGAIPSGDCPAKRGDVDDSPYRAGLTGSYQVPIKQSKFEVGKTYAVKGCLMDQNAQYTGDETNTVAFTLTLLKKTPKYKLTGLERLTGKAYDAEAFAAAGPGYFKADYYLGLGQPIKLRTTVKNIGGAPPTSGPGQKIALTLWLEGTTGGIGSTVEVPAPGAYKSRVDILSIGTGGSSGVGKGFYQISIDIEQLADSVPSADKAVSFDGPRIYIRPQTWELWPVMIRIFKPTLPLSGPGAVRVRVRNYGSTASVATTVHFWDLHGCYPTLDLPLAAVPANGGAAWSSSSDFAWGIPLSSCVPDVRAAVYEADKTYPSFSTGKVTIFTDSTAFLAN
jgi:hypothetical protein